MPDATARPPTTVVRRLRAALLELMLIAALYLLYGAGRVLAMGQESLATANARAVHDLERALHLPAEAALQGLVPADVLQAANVYYVAVHFPAIIVFLVWGFLRRPRRDYLWARNLIVVQTTLAVIIHIVFPLAPPRMFEQWGFLDTMARYGPSAYDGASETLANQYAAMPSLHVGWAVLIAYVVHRTGPPTMRPLVWTHAAVTVAVVTVTANHWILDGVVAIALLALANAIFPAPGPDPSPDHTAHVPRRRTIRFASRSN